MNTTKFGTPHIISLVVFIFLIIFVFFINKNKEVAPEVKADAQVTRAVSGEVTLTGAEKKLFEEYLQKEGFFKGTPNESFTKETERAIKTFQVSIGIEPTGTISKDWQPVDRSMMPPEDEIYTACDVDFDGNGVINVNDLIAFMGAFGTMPEEPIMEDINDDEVVNISDMLIFISFFGQSAECNFFTSIEGYSHHTCGLSALNKIYCFGTGTNIGDGNNVNDLIPVEVDMSNTGDTNNFVFLGDGADGGSFHTCAINTIDKLYCWGFNPNGGIGIGNQINQLTPVEVDVSSLGISNSFIDVSTGGSGTCAIHENGILYCFGYNGYGQLGSGTTTGQLTPVAVNVSNVSEPNSFKSVSKGNSTTCAITIDDRLYCWGDNYYGQLGNGSTLGSLVPAVEPNIDPNIFKKVSSGTSHTCAIYFNDALYCWGNNDSGQLGIGTTVNQLGPVEVDVSSLGIENNFTDVDTGENSTCALHSTGKVYCFGINNFGQLGSGTTTSQLTPVEVSFGALGISNSVVKISVGATHVCLVHSNDGSYCFGHNFNGKLGNGDQIDQLTPVPVDMTNVE